MASAARGLVAGVRRLTKERANPLTGLRRLRDFYDGASYVRELLREPIDAARCGAVVRARVAARVPTFIDMMEQAIFAYSDSPYRPLLEAAGYDLPRIKALVSERGLEEGLETLCRQGVYVSIEEFRGTREVRRGGLTYRCAEGAFNSPLIKSGLVAISGGTRSRGMPTIISASDHRLGAEHLALALSAYGLQGAPVAVWMPSAHGASLWAVLALAATGHPVPYWFTQLPRRVGTLAGRYARYLGVRASALLHGIRLPPAIHVPIGGESRVVRWLTPRTGRPSCGIFTTPSSALRLALAAKRLGADLGHVTFITIAEPLTPTKAAAIHSVGARAFSSLGFTEFGRATYGCASPAGVDDGHVCLDAIAVTQRRRGVDRFGTETDALLLTALRSDARKVLLNVESGDYAIKTRRRCGCALDAVGWTEHLGEIRSFEKLNAEGPPFAGSQLICLIEETLPERFGGDPTDYQLLEEEDREGFTRLSVLVHPRLGPIDEQAVLACVDQTLWSTHGLSARVWAEAGTVKVRRAVPMLTKAGKLMPLHHLRVDR